MANGSAWRALLLLSDSTPWFLGSRRASGMVNLGRRMIFDRVPHDRVQVDPRVRLAGTCRELPPSDRLTRQTLSSGKTRDADSSCINPDTFAYRSWRGRPSDRRDVRAVSLLPLAGRVLRPERSRGTEGGARRRRVDSGHA